MRTRLEWFFEWQGGFGPDLRKLFPAYREDWQCTVCYAFNPGMYDNCLRCGAARP